MKKITITMLLLAAATGISAQPAMTSTMKYVDIVPSEITYDGKSLFFMADEQMYDDGIRPTKIELLDDELNPVKTFSPQSIEKEKVTTIRERAASYILVDDGDGNTHEEFDGYNGEWQEERKAEPVVFSCETFSLYGNVQNINDNYVVYSQTFFNSDEVWEYLASRVEILTTVKEEDRDGDGDVDRVVTTETPRRTEWDVVTESGKVLFSITPEYKDVKSDYQGFYLNGYIVNDKKYLVVIHDWLGDTGVEYEYFFYRFANGSMQSVKQMAVPGGMRVSPAVADRNETITVNLDQTAERLSEVVVANAAGQTVYRTAIQPGECTVKVPASALGQGLNMITVMKYKGKAQTCKVIRK